MNIRFICTFMATLCLMSFASAQTSSGADPLRIAVAGVTHDHLAGVVSMLGSDELQVVGVYESDSRYLHSNSLTEFLPEEMFFSNLERMLDQTKPEAVVAYGSIKEHLAVVEACAPRGVHVMVEKPLATDMKDAKKMEELARKNGILLLVNYETTWYSSNHFLKALVDKGTFGDLFRIEVNDGHQGPFEIGCSKKFTNWLTDPELNGGGAVIDFGCYGANIATWLLEGKKPEFVYAVLQRNKPSVYPNVDDDATIILTYPGLTVQINASWCWPYNRKDMFIYGIDGYANQQTPSRLQYSADGKTVTELDAPALEKPFDNSFRYLKALVRGEIELASTDLSALDNNMVVMEILDAAKKSARLGKPVRIK